MIVRNTIFRMKKYILLAILLITIPLSIRAADTQPSSNELASIVSSLQSLLSNLQSLFSNLSSPISNLGSQTQFTLSSSNGLAQISGVGSGLIAHYTFDDQANPGKDDSNTVATSARLPPSLPTVRRGLRVLMQRWGVGRFSLTG